MILHALIVDDEQANLDSLGPFVSRLAEALRDSPDFQQANRDASCPLPPRRLPKIRVTAHGYTSQLVSAPKHADEVHIRLHLCCDGVGGFAEVLRLINDHFVAVAVSDLRFTHAAARADRAGQLLVDHLTRQYPETHTVLYSAFEAPPGAVAERFVRKGEQGASAPLVECMVQGFTRYLQQPRICRIAQQLEKQGLIYRSDAFGKVLTRLATIADRFFNDEEPTPGRRKRPLPTLLIDGESGTSKTALATLLHLISPRDRRPFVAVRGEDLANVAVLRSTLFGHTKELEPGTIADRVGIVEKAQGGILLLDDLHQLPRDSSVILHEFLDQGSYNPLGREQENPTRAEAAIVCTVKTPHWTAIKEKQELDDSFIARVEQTWLSVPSLASRPEDIACLAQHRCGKDQKLPDVVLGDDALEWMIEYGFPGRNIRGLHTLIDDCILAHKAEGILTADHLVESARTRGWIQAVSVAIPPIGPNSPAPPLPTLDERWEYIAELITRALQVELLRSRAEAEALSRKLLGAALPDIWQTYTDLESQHGMGFGLLADLIRYYAVLACGNLGGAARRLRMRSEGLRASLNTGTHRYMPEREEG